MTKVLFRADGNSKMGLGHIYRSLALAEMLKEDFGLVFCIKKPIPFQELKNKILSICSECQVIDEGDKEQELNTLIDFMKKDDIIVLDGYHFDSLYQKALRSNGNIVVSIDDIHQTYFYSDVVINHAPGITSSDYTAESYTDYFFGPKYSLLRPKFIELAENKRRKIKKLESAFICFGGADPLSLTIKTLRILLQQKGIKKINVVTGGEFQQPESIDKIKNKSSVTVSCYHNIGDQQMASLMKESDFAIVPSSTILYEVIAARLPAITGYYVDNQFNIYDGFTMVGGVLGVGRLTEESISKGLTKLTLKKCETIQHKQKKIIDGKSPKRIRDIFKCITT